MSDQQNIEELNSLHNEIRELRNQLADAEVTIEAIRTGNIDAIIVSGAEGENVYTLVSEETPYRKIIESMSESAITIGENGIILFANNTFAKATGRPLESIIGSNVTEYFPPEIKEVFLNKAGYFADNNQVFESVLSKPGGNRVSLQFSVSRLPPFVPGKFCLIGADFTELKAKSEQLALSERKFHQLHDHMTDAVQLCELFYDDHGTPVDILMIEVNPAFENMTGRSREEMAGKTFSSANLEISPVWMTRYDQLVKTGDPLELEEYDTLLGKWLRVSACRVEGNKFFAIFSDITGRKNDEIRLKEYAEALKSSNETKDRFFTIVAHDLRSPFQVLFGLSETLADEFESLKRSEIKAISLELNSYIERQYQMLNDLLQWSAMQRETQNVNKELIDIHFVAEEIIESVRILAKTKNISVTNNIATNIEIFTDPQMVRLIIRNLLTNSLKFTPKGGWIKIGTEYMDDQIEISVTDNGIGISPEEQALLFRKDKLFTTRGTNNEMGSGLGLLLCKEIVEKLGGNIHIESTLGEGSSFKFRLNP